MKREKVVGKKCLFHSRVVELIEVLASLSERQKSKMACRPASGKGFGWDEM